MALITLLAVQIVSPPVVAPPPPVRTTRPLPPPAPIAPPSPASFIAIDKSPTLDRFYPPALRGEKAVGEVQVGVSVDGNGHVIGCRIAVSSGISSLDEASCRAARTARYRMVPGGGHGVPLKFSWSPAGSSVKAGQPGHRVVLDMASIASGMDYPPAAIRAGEEGTTGVRLDVSAAGVVTGCAVLLSSGSAVLDAETCRVFTTRARFRPAVDDFGEAVASTVSQRMRWKLPVEKLPIVTPAMPKR